MNACNFTSRNIAGAPALLAHVGDPPANAPTVLWFHGLGVDKETHQPELQLLAESGFLAIGIDAIGHGERRLPNLERLIDASRDEAFATAVNLAVQTAAEVPAIIKQLVTEELADPRRVSLAGISMGAFVLYRALVECRSIDKAVAILGSPKWPFARSPHHEFDAFCATELLSITAEQDANVPPSNARDLHYALEERCPDRHRYVELNGAVHLMSEQHWAQTKFEMLRWLQA